MKNTKTRQRVKDILLSTKSPLTPAEIFSQLKAEGITLSSIYRTLDTFTKEGIVIKANDQKGTAIYTINTDDHCHYLECKNCHEKIKLDYCPYHNVNSKISKQYNFELEESNVVLYGLCNHCSSCKSKQEAKQKTH